MDAQWMTYGEYAERTGRTPHAARLRAARKHWRRQLGNDGKARILVPPEELERPLEPPPEPRLEQEPEQVLEPRLSGLAELLTRLATLQTEMSTLVQQLATAESRAGAAEGELRAVREERDRLLGQSAEDRGERDRLAAELIAMQERVFNTEHHRDRLARELDTHLRLPWWRRLFA